MVSNLASRANHHARAVIDEEMRADRCSRMDIDACGFVRPFSEHAGDEWNTQLVQLMRQSKYGDSFQTGVAKDHFV